MEEIIKFSSEDKKQFPLVRLFLKKVMNISEFEIKQVHEDDLFIILNAIDVILKFKKNFNENFLIKDLDDRDLDVQTFIALCKVIITIDKFSTQERAVCSLKNYCILVEAASMSFKD